MFDLSNQFELVEFISMCLILVIGVITGLVLIVQGVREMRK